jgi:hypothetical protein
MTERLVTLSEAKGLLFALAESGRFHQAKQILRSLRPLRMTERLVTLSEAKGLLFAFVELGSSSRQSRSFARSARPG